MPVILFDLFKKLIRILYHWSVLPECHYESNSIEEDIQNLKKKIDHGVTHLITQLFFDNRNFYSFLEKVRQTGITVPIEAGIMRLSIKIKLNGSSACAAPVSPRN
jgi:methylenetetrahydrofolate reductase (NADPH)